jgi:hypothetical protein
MYYLATATGIRGVTSRSILTSYDYDYDFDYVNMPTHIVYYMILTSYYDISHLRV